MVNNSSPQDHRKCVLSDAERNEFSDLVATRVVELFFARISAAADAEESKRVQAIGRWVDGFWKRWRWRILFSAGCLGVALAAGVHFSKKEILEMIIKLLAEV